jgi:hypothetical protein
VLERDLLPLALVLNDCVELLDRFEGTRGLDAEKIWSRIVGRAGALAADAEHQLIETVFIRASLVRLQRMQQPRRSWSLWPARAWLHVRSALPLDVARQILDGIDFEPWLGMRPKLERIAS